MFDFDSFPFKLSGKIVDYICPKCKNKFITPIEAVLEFEFEDELNGLPSSTPPYTICSKCNFDKCIPIDYTSKRGFHHKYTEKNNFIFDYTLEQDFYLAFSAYYYAVPQSMTFLLNKKIIQF